MSLLGTMTTFFSEYRLFRKGGGGGGVVANTAVYSIYSPSACILIVSYFSYKLTHVLFVCLVPLWHDKSISI